MGKAGVHIKASGLILTGFNLVTVRSLPAAKAQGNPLLWSIKRR